MGEQHGYGIARRIEQTSQGKLSINYGTLYPQLLKLEQEGLIASHWGVSDNNRKAKFYKLTRAGRKQIERDTRQWEATNAIMTRFLAARGRPWPATPATAGPPTACSRSARSPGTHRTTRRCR